MRGECFPASGTLSSRLILILLFTLRSCQSRWVHLVKHPFLALKPSTTKVGGVIARDGRSHDGKEGSRALTDKPSSSDQCSNTLAQIPGYDTYHQWIRNLQKVIIVSSRPPPRKHGPHGQRRQKRAQYPAMGRSSSHHRAYDISWLFHAAYARSQVIIIKSSYHRPTRGRIT